MSIFDEHGFWLFGNDGTMDEEQQEEQHQDKLCRLMEQYQAYRGIIKGQRYVLRGSIIVCKYGTNPVLLDMPEDYGLIWSESKLPVVTCADCFPHNIYHFGSCLCPESNYSGRLPMTVSRRPGEKMMAIKAPQNIFSHICVPLINIDQGWKQIDSNTLVEVGQKGYAPMLLDDAVLICQYGGIIRILEVPDGTEMEELEWIPSQIMQLNGNSVEEQNLLKYINDMNANIEEKAKTDGRYKNLLWGQDKLDIVWEKCRDFYEDYGVQVDPRMFLAIIIAEGTGSFNTSTSNKAGDGGNGPGFDFETDCTNAVDLLGGKIVTFQKYHDEFSVVVQEAHNKNLPGMEKVDTVDILHYLNWKTPRLSFISTEFQSGVYADDNQWHRKVRDIYSYLVDNNQSFETRDYTDYILGLDETIFSKVADDEGIDVNKQVTFTIEQNGMDENRKPNGEYTVVGNIGP